MVNQYIIDRRKIEKKNVLLNISDSTVKCPQPPKIPNTYSNAPSGQATFPIGTMFVYDCLAGYQPQPEAITHAWCLKDGVWLEPSINCTRRFYTVPTLYIICQF